MNNTSISQDIKQIISGLERREPWSRSRGGFFSRGVKRLSSNSVYHALFGYGSLFRWNQPPLAILNRQIAHLTRSLKEMNEADLEASQLYLAVIAEQMKEEISKIDWIGRYGYYQKIVLKVWTVVYALFFGTITSDFSAVEEMRARILPEYEVALKQRLVKAVVGDQPSSAEKERCAHSIEKFVKFEDKRVPLQSLLCVPRKERRSLLEAFDRLETVFALIEKKKWFEYKVVEYQKTLLEVLENVKQEKRSFVAAEFASLFSLCPMDMIENFWELCDIVPLIALLPNASNPHDKNERERFYSKVVSFAVNHKEKLSNTLACLLFAWDANESIWEIVLNRFDSGSQSYDTAYAQLGLKEKRFTCEQIAYILKFSFFPCSPTRAINRLAIAGMSYEEKTQIILQVERIHKSSAKGFLDFIADFIPQDISFEKKMAFLNLVAKKEMWCMDDSIREKLFKFSFEECFAFIDKNMSNAGSTRYFQTKPERSQTDPECKKDSCISTEEKLVCQAFKISKLPATVQELHQLYKKWALKNHPDKNRAPGATEEFQKLTNAIEFVYSEYYQSPL